MRTRGRDFGMNITLNIQAGSPAELQEAITGLAGIFGEAAAPQLAAAQEEPEKPKRATRTTAKPEKPQDPEPVKEQEAKDESAESTTESENAPTVVELRAKAQEKGTTPEAKKAIKALLEEFGSKSISDIPEEKRAAFLAALEEL